MGGQRYKILVVVARLININLLLGRQTKAVAGWADFLKKYIFAIAIAIPKMIHEELARQIARQFAYPFTADQHEAVNKLARFVVTPRRSEAFILRGYAGTGKTSLVGALVKVLTQLKREVVLLAPTGRAAKVFSLHSGMQASTIHRCIYRQQTFNGESTRFSLGYNKLQHALFVVDEASMINNSDGASLFGTGQLLSDLIEYVYSGEGCRLLFVGDEAQLPPVGCEESPALSAEEICSYGLHVTEAALTEVVRQEEASGVLAGATRLRNLLQQGFEGLPKLSANEKGEVRFLPGSELIEALTDSYSEYGVGGTIVVTRSNKRANIYNNGIRARIFDREDELTRGDLVMAVKNNYYWAEKLARSLPKEERLPFDFIANGDVAEVVQIRGVHTLYGFRFADATLRFPDYDDYELTCRVLLSTLISESPSLTAEESRRLFDEVEADYADIPQRKERMKRLRQDPYYNALQIKYAYAVTCHKAQGGQWQRVFIDQGYVTPEMGDASYLRWLYTAYTRTTDRLYLVNWPEEQREVE